MCKYCKHWVFGYFDSNFSGKCVLLSLNVAAGEVCTFDNDSCDHYEEDKINEIKEVV